MTRTIDVNCDCGESFGHWKLGNDEALLPYVSSVNLACGFHAGDPVTMVASVRRAKEHGLAVGAHPGLPDLAGFGRRMMTLSVEEAYADIVYQVGALRGVLEAEGLPLHHVKLHGALAFIAAETEPIAAAIVDAVERVAPEPLIYSPVWPRSHLHAIARDRGITVVEEMYPDVRYNADGSLNLERRRAAVPLEEGVAQVESLLLRGEVTAVDGTTVPFQAGSLSFHGDAPNAVELARGIHEAVNRLGARVAAPEAGAEVAGA